MYRVGDRVCVALLQKTFEKLSLQRWGREIFFIHKVFATNPITYQLVDQNKEMLTG